jgi:hypothetical protein
MPNVQIRGSQIQVASVEASNINLSGSFDLRAASGVQFLTKPEADKTTFPATTAFVHGIVSGSIIDGFQGGDGIAINVGTSPDTIAVDLGTNPGLQFASNKLVLKAKSESGGTITLDGDGIYLADGAVSSAKLAGSIANAKLANSTISGKALGANLDNLTDGNGIADFSYNGSSAGSIALDLDGSTLTVGADGVKVSTGGIANNEIGNSAAIAQSKLALDITNSEINASAAIAISKLAASTISGKALGTNLDSLTDGNGIADFTYNGSGAGSIAIDLDGSSLSVGASGLKIADDGVGAAQIADDAVGSAAIADDAVGSAQIADNAVDNARIANGAVSIAKLAFQARADNFNPNGSTLAFDLTNQVAPEFDNFVMCFVNGLLQSKVASSPSGQQEYTVSTAGSTTTITFGANIDASAHIEVRYLA